MSLSLDVNSCVPVTLDVKTDSSVGVVSLSADVVVVFDNVSQRLPWKPVGQTQVNDASLERQVPPLKHGEAMHGSSSWQWVPKYPSLQLQL